MSEIKILPIFNQSAPGIWDDMLRVRIAAMRYNYNIRLTSAEKSDAMSEFHDSWNRLSHNFAFAAYDGERMVGCLNGDIQKQTAYIRHLYILPEYQGKQIGAGLLRAAENAVSLSARQADIIALAGAEKFYRRMGYNSPVNTNNYVKQLTAPKCRSVPIFHCAPAFVRACSKLTHGTSMPDIKRINSEHLPVFADFDEKSKLRAIASFVDGATIMRSNHGDLNDWLYRSMSRIVNNYLSVAQEIRSRQK